jgi:hypothetical protein
MTAVCSRVWETVYSTFWEGVKGQVKGQVWRSLNTQVWSKVEQDLFLVQNEMPKLVFEQINER